MRSGLTALTEVGSFDHGKFCRIWNSTSGVMDTIFSATRVATLKAHRLQGSAQRAPVRSIDPRSCMQSKTYKFLYYITDVR